MLQVSLYQGLGSKSRASKAWGLECGAPGTYKPFLRFVFTYSSPIWRPRTLAADGGTGDHGFALSQGDLHLEQEAIPFLRVTQNSHITPKYPKSRNCGTTVCQGDVRL